MPNSKDSPMLTATATDIDFGSFAIELSELQRTITRFLDAVDLGEDAQPSFAMLVWQLNSLSDLYS